MKKIKHIRLGILGIEYREYDCPFGLYPWKCPNLPVCLGNAVRNEYKDDCIYIEKSK